MNENMKFDPMTGEPLNNAETPVVEQPTNVESIEQAPVQPIEQNNIETQAQISNEQNVQTQLQSIPTVGQNEQDFINNVQSMNKEKKEEKKEGINFVFIIILFVIILVAIYFLFPLLLDYI